MTTRNTFAPASQLLQSNRVNDKFASLSASLDLAERKARRDLQEQRMASIRPASPYTARPLTVRRTSASSAATAVLNRSPDLSPVSSPERWNPTNQKPKHQLVSPTVRRSILNDQAASRAVIPFRQPPVPAFMQVNTQKFYSPTSSSLNSSMSASSSAFSSPTLGPQSSSASATGGEEGSLASVRFAYGDMKHSLLLSSDLSPIEAQNIIRSVFALQENVVGIYEPKNQIVFPFSLVIRSPSSFPDLYYLVLEQSGVQQPSTTTSSASPPVAATNDTDRELEERLLRELGDYDDGGLYYNNDGRRGADSEAAESLRQEFWQRQRDAHYLAAEKAALEAGQRKLAEQRQTLDRMRVEQANLQQRQLAALDQLEQRAQQEDAQLRANVQATKQNVAAANARKNAAVAPNQQRGIGSNRVINAAFQKAQALTRIAAASPSKSEDDENDDLDDTSELSTDIEQVSDDEAAEDAAFDAAIERALNSSQNERGPVKAPQFTESSRFPIDRSANYNTFNQSEDDEGEEAEEEGDVVVGGQFVLPDKEILELEELQEKTGFASIAPSALFDIFRSRQERDGRLTRQAFDEGTMEFLRQTRIADQPSQQKAVLVLSRLFDLFDVERNGSIQFAQLATGLSIIGQGDRDEKIKLAFAAYDENQTGLLSFSSVEHYLESFFIIVFDLSQSLQESILPHTNCTQLAHATAKHIFQSAQRTNQISYGEFRRWYDSSIGDSRIVQDSEEDDQEEDEEDDDDESNYDAEDAEEDEEEAISRATDAAEEARFLAARVNQKFKEAQQEQRARATSAAQWNGAQPRSQL